jgi:hypothetical protein
MPNALVLQCFIKSIVLGLLNCYRFVNVHVENKYTYTQYTYVERSDWDYTQYTYVKRSDWYIDWAHSITKHVGG